MYAFPVLIRHWKRANSCHYTTHTLLLPARETIVHLHEETLADDVNAHAGS